MNTTELAWFKSSYSNAEGEACLEVAYTWRKSSYSNNEGGACVEIAACPHTIHIRDSKNLSLDADAPTLAVAPVTWTTFLRTVG
ncbi:DUF397 domain-containing protein [Streptomyces sp. SID12488]|uniref:DUF397 domain-containing protein n=1 Tax=Streptomyces sp. SID12488 TaxID=2706040 RepID=UPI0013D9ADFA|nr:DUF397 domain-containing protein [Streptomyces sp. SID12488]